MTFDRERVPSRMGPLVAASVAMRDVQKEAELAARLDIRVMMSGEYGVGKRRLARLIHAEGSRRHGQFLQVRCGQEPEAHQIAERIGQMPGSWWSSRLLTCPSAI